MICLHCNHELLPDQRFCSNCGAIIEVKPSPASTFADQQTPEFKDSQIPTSTAPPVQPITSNGLALASFILGLSSFLTIFWCSFLSIPAGIIGLILGLVSKNNPLKSGFTTAGITLSLIGIVLSLAHIVFLIIFLAANRSH